MSAKKKPAKYISEWRPYMVALDKAAKKLESASADLEKIDFGNKISQFEIDIAQASINSALIITTGAIDNLRRIDEIAELENQWNKGGRR